MTQAYCPQCGKHTDQYPIVNSYALTCGICKLQTAGTQRAETEANKFYTPDGSEATLVQNDSDKAVFSVDSGKEKGLYVYDKKSGFGGVQKR